LKKTLWMTGNILCLLGFSSFFEHNCLARTDPILQAARAFHYQGAWEKALKLYIELASQPEHSPEALLAVGALLEERQGDFDRAKKIYRKAIRSGFTPREASLWLAFIEGKYTQDLSTPDAWSKDPLAYWQRKYAWTHENLRDSALSHFWHAAHLEQKQRPLGALDHLLQCSALQDFPEIVLLKQGLLLLEQGEFQDAMDSFISFLECHPDLSHLTAKEQSIVRSVIHYQEGQDFRKDGRLSKARECFAHSLKEFDGLPHIYSAMAETLMALGKDDLAVRAYREGLQRDPFAVSMHRGLCLALDRLGKPLELAKAYTRYRTTMGTLHDSDTFTVWAEGKLRTVEESLSQRRNQVQDPAELHNLGVHYLELELLELAEDALKAALFRGSNASSTWGSLGNCLMAMERFKEAGEAYEAALKLDPNKETTRANLAHILLMEKKHNEARSHYEFLINSKHRSMQADAHYNLGIIHLEQGNREETLKEFALAIALESGHVRAHNNLGIIQEQLGLMDQAEQSYLRAILLSPWHKTARLNLATLLLREDRPQEAVLCLRPLQRTPLWDEETNNLLQRASSNPGNEKE